MTDERDLATLLNQLEDEDPYTLLEATGEILDVMRTSVALYHDEQTTCSVGDFVASLRRVAYMEDCECERCCHRLALAELTRKLRELIPPGGFGQ